jgi:branched-subunit amino acid aminotransferase/4-amino-4-deoxychorismate lyase
MIYEMDEVFLTNAIRKIQPVGRLGTREYRQEIAGSLIY